MSSWLRVSAQSRYRQWLRQIHRNNDNPVVIRRVFVEMSSDLIGHYIRILFYSLITATGITCLIQTEWGMWHFSALLLAWPVRIIAWHHQCSSMIIAMRNRIRSHQKFYEL